MERLKPGVYISADGNMCFDAVEICVALGEEPTERNQEIVVRAYQASVARYFPGIPAEVRIDDADPR
jgi:hypothetical protein